MQYVLGFLVNLFSRWGAMILGFILLVVAIYLAIIFVPAFFSSPEEGFVAPVIEEFGLVPSSVKRDDLSGDIIMSGKLLGNDNNPMRSFGFSLSGETVGLVDLSEKYGVWSSSMVELDDVQDPKKVFISSAAFTADNRGYQQYSRAVFRVERAEDSSLTADMLASVSNGDIGTISYSEESDHLAYAVMNGQRGNGSTVSDWDVVVVDNAGVIKHSISGAAHPEWSPDGNYLIYAKEDGLYTLDINLGNERLVVSIAGRSQDGQVIALPISAMFAISPDGSVLLITINNQIETYVINNWSEFFVTPTSRLVSDTNVYSWPVFSPDGKSYAVLSRSTSGDISSLEIRPLQSKDVIFSHDLSSFGESSVIIDTWSAVPFSI